MGYWVGVVTAQEYRAERLFQHTTVELDAGAPSGGGPPVAGDEVVLVAAAEPGTRGGVVFGLGRVRGAGPAEVAYTHRLFDEPLPATGQLAATAAVPGLHPLDEATYAEVAGKVGPELRVDGTRRDWLVSVALPIEASTPAEAVRAFWTYVHQLGPAQLPAFVSPSDDELAMQAYLLGEPTNLDPEEEDA